MIDDLDRSLEDFLKRGLPPELVSQVDLSFEIPDSSFPPSGVKLPAIDLFLYDMRENRELRSNEKVVERTPGGAVSIAPAPVRVDCSYLVTAWASANSSTKALDEHRLLGEVMQLMLRFPRLPAEVLRGVLSGKEPPLRTVSLHAGQLQSPGEFWQALGGRPKAAFHYTVTLSMDVGRAAEFGPPVTDTRIKVKQGHEEAS